MARHISSSHQVLKSLLEERFRLNEASSQPGSEAQPQSLSPPGQGSLQPQPPLGQSGQPDIHPQSSCLSSKTDVSTSMNLTQVKYLREKTNCLFVFCLYILLLCSVIR